MKKSILAVAVLIGATSFAQDDKQYLPESGDWAIGIDATPFLNYAGNLIGGNDGNVAPTWNYLTNNQTITGKYMASEDMAYRAHIRLGFGSMNSANMVGDDNVTTAPVYPALPSTVEDTYKSSYNMIGLGGGIEYRKNHNRLVGFYGGELGIAISGGKDTYTYGNSVVPANGFPTSSNFGSNITTDTYGNTARITEMKNGSTFGIGLRGFIGAEYFVLPRIAVGGEFGWGLVFSSTGASSTTMESTDGTTAGTQTIEGSKSSAFGIDTDAVNSVFGPAGTLRMTFYF